MHCVCKWEGLTVWETKEGDADGISVYVDYLWYLVFGLITSISTIFGLEIKHIATAWPGKYDIS